jgi:hypothetical protein
MTIRLQSDVDNLEQRGSPRSALLLPAQVRERGKRSASSSVLSLSASGCRIKGNLSPGDQVWIKLAGLDAQPGNVTWSMQDEAGVKFERALHPAVAGRYCGTFGSYSAPQARARIAPEQRPASRRQQVLGGIAEPNASPVQHTKTPTIGGLHAVIRRRVARCTNHRQGDRFGAAGRTALVAVAGLNADAVVENVSASGLRLRLETPMTVGQRATVQFEACAPVEGRIVWSKHGRIGVELLGDAIDLVEREE